MLRISLIFLIFSACASAGEVREWTNSEGTKSFDAEFICQEGDNITLKRSDGSEITFDISRLHKDDHKWLKANHRTGGKNANLEISDKDAIFDTLKFGDSRESVMEKLRSSSVVETEIEEAFFARTGLNGAYRTKQKIGGLYCYLFYDWDNSGNLTELTLTTEPQPESQYGSSIKSCWDELPALISMLHGLPVLDGDMPVSSKLEEGSMLGSHLWRIEGGGSVLLGIAKVENKYEVSVRFTLEKIDMKPIP